MERQVSFADWELVRQGLRLEPLPKPGQRALLADPRFVLEADFDRLALGVTRERRCNGRGKVFLNSA